MDTSETQHPEHSLRVKLGGFVLAESLSFVSRRIDSMKKFVFGLLAVVTSVLIYFAAVNSRAATETAPFTVVKAAGEFELRQYEEMHLARTPMGAGIHNDEARDSSFIRLFRYISGTNEREEKIAMTTPVLMSSEEGYTAMNFVMPKATAVAGAPRPKPGVSLEKLPPMKVVAVRFSGVSSLEAEARQLARLKEWAASERLSLHGQPLIAYYDPPWTPGFLRRNEVLMRVKE